MGKVFTSDPEIENGRVYLGTRLIYNYTPSEYEEPVSQYSVDQLTDQIRQDVLADDSNVGLHFPQCCK